MIRNNSNEKIITQNIKPAQQKYMFIFKTYPSTTENLSYVK